MDISVIIVSWNVRTLLRRCLQSVQAEIENEVFPTAEVVVVDNASDDGSADVVRLEFPWVRLIVNEQNVGFTRGNNQAFPFASGRYLLLLNPDAEVVPGALRALREYMDARSEVGVVGPKLVFPDGSVQSSRRRFPRYSTAFLESTILQRYFPRHRLLEEYYVTDVPEDRVQAVDWVVGACMLVRREALSDANIFDERFFMYSEEMDLCYRLKKAGWQVIYHPGAKVIHHEAQSSGQDVLSRNIHFHDSKCKFFGKAYGPLHERLLRAFVVATFVYQIVEESAKFVLVARNRGIRRRRLSVLTSAARWHFGKAIWMGG